MFVSRGPGLTPMLPNDQCVVPDTRQRQLLLAVIIGVTCCLFIIEQFLIAKVNDWWVDELFALWASDRNFSFTELFYTRIASDSNPPLFFSLLHFARLVIVEDRIAVVVLNTLGLAVAAAALLAMSWRSRMREWIALSVALFVLGGPVAAYVPEARSYCLAMTISYVAVVFAALAVLEKERPRSHVLFVLVGVIAALSHVFAALLCCAVAAGMFGCGVLFRNSKLTLRSLTLLASTVASSLIWIALWLRLGPGTLAQVNWIPFTAAFVWESGLGALDLTYGTPWLALAFVGVLITAGSYRLARAPALLVGVSAAAFIVAPILISFRVPIIVARYWLVGSPLFLASVGLLMGSWRSGRPALVLMAVATVLVIVGMPLSFRAAYHFVAQKPVWSSVPKVKAQLAGCGPNTIHVLGFMPGFSIMTGAPDSTFVDARTLAEDTRPATITCSILGWSEHYVLRYGPDYTSRATPTELLKLLKLAYNPHDVVIDRHKSGFVVTRARN